MNNLALVTFLFFAFFLFFSNKSIIFVFIFNSPSVQHSKNRSTIMKKYFFFYILLLLPIIGIQIHRCGRRFEQQTGICNSKGT